MLKSYYLYGAYRAYAAPVSHGSNNRIKLERIQKPATKIMCATGDLNCEQWMKATDMPSINGFLTEMRHEHFYKISTNETHPLFSRIAVNQVSSHCQFRRSSC